MLKMQEQKLSSFDHSQFLNWPTLVCSHFRHSSKNDDPLSAMGWLIAESLHHNSNGMANSVSLTCRSPYGGLFLKDHFDLMAAHNKQQGPGLAQRFLVEPYEGTLADEIDLVSPGEKLRELKMIVKSGRADETTLNRAAKAASQAFFKAANDEEDNIGAPHSTGDSSELRNIAGTLSQADPKILKATVSKPAQFFRRSRHQR